MLGCALAPSSVAQNFTGDASPDIVWRQQSGANTYLWEMAGGVVYTNSHWLGASGSDTQWKIVGIADFGSMVSGSSTNLPDGKPDILWQHQTVSYAPGVWLMNGTQYAGGFPILSLPTAGWRFVGAGDFGSVVNDQPSTTLNGAADIVLQHDTTGQMQFWLLKWPTNVPVVVPTTAESLPAGWKICAVGDFGSPTSSTPDGKPDLVLASYPNSFTNAAGHVMIRFQNGYESTGQHLVWNKAGTNNLLLTFAHQLDMEIVGAADYTQDGKTDLLVRIGTDGRHKIWTMNGTNFLGELDVLNAHNGYQPLQTYETDWRMNTQAITNNTWRLAKFANPMITAKSFSTPTPRIDLLIHDFTLMGSETFSVRRRLAGSTGSFTELASGITVYSYSDSTASVGIAYEYEIQRMNLAGLKMHVTAVIDPPVTHDRGRILLVVDNTLASQIESSLNILTNDMIGDGWTVVRTNVARYQDPNWNQANADAMADLKTWITNTYDQSPGTTKCVLLIGHVPIPYSGTDASDGHSDHPRAWTADAYYGDVVGPAWTPHPSVSGQFANNGFPSRMELAVGRVDFARLSHLLQAKTEAQLIQDYIAKSHRYRHQKAPYPVNPKVAYFTYHHEVPVQSAIAKRTGRLISVADLNNIMIADPFRNSSTFQNSSSPAVGSLFAVAAGNGAFPEIYNNISGGTYTSSMIAGNAEPPSVIWMINGSYFTDFNEDNDFPRTILGRPSYGLVVLPSSDIDGGSEWKLERFFYGEPVGLAYLETANFHGDRWICLLGDPTLRYAPPKPPLLVKANLSSGMVNLEWSPCDSVNNPPCESGQLYHMYRAATVAGPFEPLTLSGALPTSQFSWSVADDASKRVYMIRSVRLTSTGSGSFWNLSQGSVRIAN